MYIRNEHRLADRDALVSLIDARPLGAWVCHAAGGLIANHLPFVLDRRHGRHGSLIGHVARANPVWRQLASPRASVVMFQGPQAYITPGWYAGKAADGQVVPTWNYIVAHVHGMARAVDDRDWLLDLLERLTTANEAARALPWRVADAPAPFIDRMLRAIVGIEIPLTQLVGKWKLSQNRSADDRTGLAAGLAQGGPVDQAVAALVSQPQQELLP